MRGGSNVIQKRYIVIFCILLAVLLYVVYYRVRLGILNPADVKFDRHALLDIKQSASITSGSHDPPEESSNPAGRHLEDGRWHSLLRPLELYTYTAHLDGRDAAAGGARFLRVISVIEMVEKLQVSCGIWYHGDADDAEPQVVRAVLLKIGYGVFRHDKYFLENIISCEVPHREKIPVAVAVIPSLPGHRSARSLVMPVETSARPDTPHQFIVCVSVSYGSHHPYRLVEWLEMQRLLGAGSVIIYNNSLAPAAADVFRHYAREGLVEFRQSHSFLPDLGELTIHLHMSPVLNDCLYRHVGAAEKIVIVDLDEVIMPHTHDTWAEMLAELERNLPAEQYYPYRSYVFKNTYFFFDLPPDAAQPEQSVFLRYRTRMPTVARDVSIKSIVDPRACVQLHNHACWARTRTRDVSHEVDVHPSYGLNHHYKRCHFDAFERVVGKCAAMLDTGIRDDTILRFRERLLVNMDHQLKKLHLEPIFEDDRF